MEMMYLHHRCLSLRSLFSLYQGSFSDPGQFLAQTKIKRDLEKHRKHRQLWEVNVKYHYCGLWNKRGEGTSRDLDNKK